ncbi:MAG: helix-turn-helix transcriptional regulator [Chthoniobacteraceae bacterium]
MPSTSDNGAYNYADRLCGRLPRALQQEREGEGVSRYALEKKSAVSRDMIGDIENGDSIPTLHLAARLAFGLRMKAWELVRRLEDDW